MRNVNLTRMILLPQCLDDERTEIAFGSHTHEFAAQRLSHDPINEIDLATTIAKSNLPIRVSSMPASTLR